MSARHDDPLRAYRSRADYLLEDLEDPDPAVSRQAARSFGWLPRFASVENAWRTLTRRDVRYTDALDVIAREEGARDWRDFVENGSPPEPDDFLRELRERAKLGEIRLQEELTGYAASWASVRGWIEVRASLPSHSYDEDPYLPPEEVVTEHGIYLPDVTGRDGSVLQIVVVLRRSRLMRMDTVPRLRALSEYAARNGAVFYVFTDGDGEYELRRMLKRRRIQVEVEVWGGMYQHEIYDALEADHWRDYD